MSCSSPQSVSTRVCLLYSILAVECLANNLIWIYAAGTVYNGKGAKVTWEIYGDVKSTIPPGVEAKV